MKQRILLLILVFITEIITFARWSSCWLFQATFYFTLQNLATNLLIAANEEKGLPLLLIRLLHNKFTGFLWGVTQTFLQYIDIRFLYELLGIVGAIGVYMGFWYFFTRKPKNKWLWLGVAILFICSFIEIVVMPHVDFSIRIIPLVLTLVGFSLFGVWEFLKKGNNKMRFGIVIFLVVVSFIALFLFPHSLYSVCLKV